MIDQSESGPQESDLDRAIIDLAESFTVYSMSRRAGQRYVCLQEPLRRKWMAVAREIERASEQASETAAHSG
jgi:hypothetical protein